MESSPLNPLNPAQPVRPVTITSVESAIAAVELQRQRYQAQTLVAAAATTGNFIMPAPGLGNNIDIAAYSRESEHL